MSKIARLASIVERAEKQALVLFIKESKQNDNTAVAMLKKRGVPEPEKVLELLKEITVDGTENGKTVWDISKTGKEIQPLAGWYCSTWNNDDLVQARERVADTVHKMYQIPSARNADLTKVWMANKELTDYEEWVEKAYEQDKAKGLIADAEEGEKVDVRAYNFPKEMLAYSDDVVDCYRANTPAEAMLLGDGYPFCISRRDGSNMFYTYRMNPTTTAYFCWFKDEQGRKSHDDMVVVHVGEDGRYMVTKSENGNFPRDNKATTIEKYPKLKGAINSGKLVVKPATDTERLIRNKYNFRSKITLDDVNGKPPEYIELILAQGVQLRDDVFEYIFKKIDKGNLRTGNNGNSLIKKYVESGVHELTSFQKDMLREAGYENEVDRAFRVYWRSLLASGNYKEMSLADFTRLVKSGDIYNKDSLLKEYIRAMGLTPEMVAILQDNIPVEDWVYWKAARVESYMKEVGDRFPGIYGKAICIVKDGKIVLEGSKDDILIRDENILFDVDIIENFRKVEFEYLKFQMMKGWSLPKIYKVGRLMFDGCSDVKLSAFDGIDVNTLYLNSEYEGKELANIVCKKVKINKAPSDRVLTFNSSVESIEFVGGRWHGVKIQWPRKLKDLVIQCSSFIRETDLKGISEEISGTFVFVASNEGEYKGDKFPNEVGFKGDKFNPDKMDFPKKVNVLDLWHFPYKKVPRAMKECDIKVITLDRYVANGVINKGNHSSDSVQILSDDVRKWVLSKGDKPSKLEVDKKETRGLDIEQVGVEGDKFYQVKVDGSFLEVDTRVDKKIGLVTFEGAVFNEVFYTLNQFADSSAIPYVLRIGDKSIAKIQKEPTSISLMLKESLYEDFSIDHLVMGVDHFWISDCRFLKTIKGLKNLKGLKSVRIINDCPKIDIELLKKELPSGVKLFSRKGDFESLSLSPLKVALNSIID